MSSCKSTSYGWAVQCLVSGHELHQRVDSQDMTVLHWGGSEGLWNLGWSKSEKQKGECIVGEMKITGERVYSNVVYSCDMLAVPNSPVFELRPGQKSCYFQMLWVSAFVEAGFVQPARDAGAVYDAHVAAAAWGSGKGAVHGYCCQKKLKGVEGEYSNKLCWQLPASCVPI
eukprot:8774211-Ditylum_brightwellii.AAC.1